MQKQNSTHIFSARIMNTNKQTASCVSLKFYLVYMAPNPNHRIQFTLRNVTAREVMLILRAPNPVVLVLCCTVLHGKDDTLGLHKC